MDFPLNAGLLSCVEGRCTSDPGVAWQGYGVDLASPEGGNTTKKRNCKLATNPELQDELFRWLAEPKVLR
jgi:hypothetical protein